MRSVLLCLNVALQSQLYLHFVAEFMRRDVAISLSGNHKIPPCHEDHDYDVSKKAKKIAARETPAAATKV